MRRTETRLLAPYRALGLVCSSIPPVYPPPLPGNERPEGSIVCAIDNVICVYSIQPLRLEYTTDPFDATISLVTADPFRIYACIGNSICVLKNRQIERRIAVPHGPKYLLSFSEMLLVVDGQNSVNVFDVESGESIVQIDSPSEFSITALVHPLTYLNKILLGSADGRMRLVNLKSGKLVYEFPSDDNFNAKITVLVQSTAVDVICVGMADGRIHLRNIKVDQIICSFKQDGLITALAFRTDGVDTLLSANSEGAIAVWDLNERILLGQKPDAHCGSVVSMHFLLGQPFVLSSGEDNKIVKWVLRNENSLPEVHTVIEGHAEPASTISYSSEFQLMSASRDGCVRRFNTNHAHRVKRFGLAREVKKGELSKNRFVDVPLSPIVQMEVSRARESVWDNLICRHEDSPLVSTWNTRLSRRGTHLLCHDRFKADPKLLSASATSICLSSCGNFAILGYSSGHLDVWNMQSGKFKFSFVSTPAEKKKAAKNSNTSGLAHTGAVTGVAVDRVNKWVVSGANDGSIHFWQFNPPSLKARIRLSSGVVSFHLDRLSSLLAVALESGELGILDVLCRRLARRFANAHPNCARVTALEFANDARWLISADHQCFLKIWDLSSGILIDVMRCSQPCLGLSFSERGDYLATCHEGQRGIYLWANKSLFFPVSIASLSTDKSYAEDTPPASISLPVIGASRDDVSDDNAENSSDSEEEGSGVDKRRKQIVVRIDEDDDEESDEKQQQTTSHSSDSMEVDRREGTHQLEKGLVTLSGLAPTRWANLPYLDLIRQRNKPKEPPKKPKAAPFFLPTVDTLEGFEFDKNAMDELMKMNVQEDGEDTEARKALMAKRRLNELNTAWSEGLLKASTSTELLDSFNIMKAMNISAVDFQLRALSSARSLAQFLAMLCAVLETRREFDLVESYLAAFLNIHHGSLWNWNTNKTQGEREGGSKENIEEDGGGEEAEEDKELKERQREEEADAQMIITKNLEKLLELQKKTLDEVQPLFDANVSLAEFIKSALI